MANGHSGASAGVVDAGRQGEEESDAPSLRWRAELGQLSRGQRTERRLVERATMVLSTLDGSIYAASRRLGYSKNTIRKWRDRFAQARQYHPQRPVEEALRGAERSGRPPEFSEAQLVALMSLATADPPGVGEPTSHWSCADLARVAVKTGRFPHLSKSHVQRLLCRDSLKPHRHKMWLNRPDDPEYDERAATVTNLLCASSEVAQAARGAEKGVPAQPALLPHIVVSFDEKCGIQALERAAPDRPMRSGKPALLEHQYRRHGTLTLLSMMNMHTGFIDGILLPQRTNEDTASSLRIFLGFLSLQGHAQITVVLDQLNTHMSMDVVNSDANLCNEPRPDEKILDTRHKRRAWLEDSARRIRFQFTPRHASWLNPIEKWFSVLARRLLRRGSFASLDELSRRIHHFIDHYNTRLARPYRFRPRQTASPVTS
jgi:transposase-like protein